MTQDVRARSQAINKDLAQHLTDSNEPNREHLEKDFVSLLPHCTTNVTKRIDNRIISNNYSCVNNNYQVNTSINRNCLVAEDLSMNKCLQHSF